MFKPHLGLQQIQNLVMTPQLQQAIKLLQFSHVELTQFLEEQALENPFLNITYASEQESEGYDSVAPQEMPQALRRLENITSHIPMSQNSFNGTMEAADLQDTLAHSLTLREHLENQIHLHYADFKSRSIACYLIDSLDESGYFIGNCQDIANELGCQSDEIEMIIRDLTTFEPVGIFSSSLKECLICQLKDQNRYDPKMAILMENLNMLASCNYEELQKKCCVDKDDLLDMIQDVKALNPKPALLYENTKCIIQTRIPDVVMVSDGKSGWLLELNHATLHRVLINESYLSHISGQGSNLAKEYITDQINHANWLIKSLDQRAKTILKVATEIVAQQDGFFRHGIESMRPLLLKDIAQSVNMHESTVSRVTSNKSISTPRGVFNLKYFFNKAISNASGNQHHSSESVRNLIAELIKQETPDQILSDDHITDLLKNKNIQIARRTVAKYRQIMDIPSSAQRKRQKKQKSFF